MQKNTLETGNFLLRQKLNFACFVHQQLEPKRWSPNLLTKSGIYVVISQILRRRLKRFLTPFLNVLCWCFCLLISHPGWWTLAFEVVERINKIFLTVKPRPKKSPKEWQNKSASPANLQSLDPVLDQKWRLQFLGDSNATWTSLKWNL